MYVITYTSWNSSNDFWGVKTFSRPIICGYKLTCNTFKLPKAVNVLLWSNMVEYMRTLTFLWLTHFMRTSSLYALLAWVWFWNGRLSFLMATFRSRIWSKAELVNKQIQVKCGQQNRWILIYWCGKFKRLILLYVRKVIFHQAGVFLIYLRSKHSPDDSLSSRANGS